MLSYIDGHSNSKIQENIPDHIWHQCTLTTCYLINIMPSKVLDGSIPYEILHKGSVDHSHLWVFGCLCFGIDPNVSDKSCACSIQSTLLGYSPSQKTYVLLNITTV